MKPMTVVQQIAHQLFEGDMFKFWLNDVKMVPDAISGA